MEPMDIYRVRVTLRGIEPVVWRQIELSGQTTLRQFHRILQIAMGWENCHLHEFVVNGQRYGVPDSDAPREVLREGRFRLAALLPQPGSEMLYIYDFGDYWQHDIRLEAIFAAEPGSQYPRVLNGARSCPPEDCGGPVGYADLLEILVNPAHEQFEDMRQWVGSRFNAEVFSADAVNERLRNNRSLAVM
jgi:hypothetical protein